MTEGNARILIVDDEANIREVLDRGLSRAGYKCVTAESADSAAEILEREEFDLALMDVTMPGRTGTDFLPEINAKYPDMVVLMLTGVADVDTAVKAMRSGAYDYVLKPASLPELMVRIEHAQSLRSLRLENKRYQARLERLVDQLNVAVEQRKRELDALNRLFQTHLRQDQTATNAYSRLKESLTLFTSELDGLAEIAGVGGLDGQTDAGVTVSEAG
jgi:DNA-binding NtrC family response regulator